MYGTVMIATAKPGAADQMVEATRRWLSDRAPHVPGFVEEWVLVGDDGVTVVAAVKFATKDDYRKLAEDPFQDELLAAGVCRPPRGRGPLGGRHVAGTPALTSRWGSAGEKERDLGSRNRS